ncbi:class I SAM-dependent methyltransferase [Geobacillus stearothermophilus]|uniref:class I SAM-dependent methyltransferase n=1 Tax=Geobacillus stearothermophilus TaxID=1422 RepID=UPI002E1D788D|nr:class I SAM-dependent methyltransferase [Geobacillus stearothermophilus]MED4355503.1 class I SAM-dependent methyltransferase [Geobacillus stearothermophilus]
MSEHYYSAAPTSKRNPQTWTFTLRGHEFRFTTDSGVFSKCGVDFGTQLLIETFEEPEVAGDLLDVGCGYGPIGLALAKSFPNRLVQMIDVNERALELARENKRANHIDNVRIYQSDLFSEVGEQRFAAVVTNPPIRAGKRVVHAIFEQSQDHLLDGGELWVVIQKKQGAPSALEKLKELFPFVEVASKKKGYYIIKAKKC